MSGVTYSTPPYGYPAYQPPVPPRRRANWPARVAVGLFLLAGGVFGFGAVFSKIGNTVNPAPTMDGPGLAAQIQSEMSRQLGEPVEVTCPATVTASKGSITDCTARDSREARMVRVTFDDSHGHLTWQLTDQKPGE